MLNSAGVLAGTPLVGGTFSFTVTATDTLGGSASQSYTVAIAGGTTGGATLSLGATGLSVAIDIANLSDGTGHIGLASATFVVTFPSGVFGFPIGGGTATAQVSFGSIPLANGGSADWNLTANSPADGTLLVTLSAKPGGIISTTAGGSLAIINFPVILNTSSPTPENIQIVAVSGSTHTQVVGSNGAYVANSLGLPANSVVVINPALQPLSIATPQSYQTETNTTLTEAAPGLLMGAVDVQGLALTVNSINGVAYTLGAPLTLPSGAVLTIRADGSFTYAPPNNFIGQDTFTFTARDTSGTTSNTGTVNITVTPTLRLSPPVATGTPGQSITEQVVLDNPNQVGTGGLAAFNLALTYPAGTLHITSVAPGPDLPADWTFTTNFQTAGVIGFAGFGSGLGMDVVTGPSPIVLATIQITLGTMPGMVPLDIVPTAVTPTGNPSTGLYGLINNFVINPQLSSSFISGVDARINIGSLVPLSLVASPLPNGTVGVVYNQTIGMVGGAAPYTFAITRGTLPAGLMLSRGGSLVGIPTTAGSFNFTVTATDAMGDNASQRYTVTIVARPKLPFGMVGTLTVNGSLGIGSSPVPLPDPSSILHESGSVSRPLIARAARLSTSSGMTGAYTSPWVAPGSRAIISIVSAVDWTLAPLALSGQLDYATLPAMHDVWASGAAGLQNTMSAAALYSVADTPRAIPVGAARALLMASRRPSWFLIDDLVNSADS